MNAIRIGIIGAGAIGKAHKMAIDKNSDCQLVAVCDIVKENAEAIADEGVKTYTDYKEMCDIEKPDAVIINLPHFLHKEVAVYCLKRKIAVLVEKPMAITAQECEQMLQAAESNNAAFAVGHVQRYYDCYQMVKELADNNKLGKLCQMIEIRNKNYFNGRPGWFLDKKLSGGGIVMNFMAHTLDKFMYVTGEKVTSVTANGNNFINENNIEACAQVLITFEGGATAMCSYCGTTTVSQYETYFYFANGSVKIINGDKLFISENGSPYSEIHLGEPNKIEDILAKQLEEFVKLCRGKASHIVTPQYGKDVVDVLEKAIYQIGN